MNASSIENAFKIICDSFLHIRAIAKLPDLTTQTWVIGTIANSWDQAYFMP